MLNTAVLAQKTYLRVCVERCAQLYLKYHGLNKAEMSANDFGKLETAHFNLRKNEVISGTDTLEQDVVSMLEFLKSTK